MRITGRSYGRAAKGTGTSSIIKNAMAVGTTIPTWAYGTQRTCENTVTVDGCSKPDNLDAPTAGQRAYRNPRQQGALKSIIANERAVGTTVFPAKDDPAAECPVHVVDNRNCSQSDNVATPQVIQRAYGSTRKTGSMSALIRNNKAVGTTVFPALGDGRLTCRSYVNAHLR